MILNRNMNTDLFFETMPTIATVVKFEEELAEIKKLGTVMPVFKSTSPNFDIDNRAHVNVISNNDLEALLALNSVYRNQMDLAFVNAPTDYNDKCFWYNNGYVPKTHSYFNSEVSYWLYNRLLLAHEILAVHGIICVQVTEQFLVIAKQLLNTIFGESNFIANHVVVHNKAGSCKNGVLQQHQYVLVYSKNKEASLSEIGYPMANTVQFCIKKDMIADESTRKYSDKYSSFDLVSNIRPQKKRKVNDNGYYPIYYIPGNTGEDGYDWEPRLSLEPTGHPEEVVLYPINEDGEDRVWNTIKTTFITNLNNSAYCVKLQNGQPKLYYKVRDNVLEPVKTILSEDMSNLTTSTVLKNIVGDKEDYVGFNPNLIKYLTEAYSKEDSSLLLIGDQCLTGLTSITMHNMQRTVYTAINENLADSNKILSALLNEYHIQFLNFGTRLNTDTNTLEFIESEKETQKDILMLKFLGLVEVFKSEQFTIYETKNYDLVVDLKVRYDLEIYLEIKDKIEKLKSQNAQVFICYISDSSYCQGTEVIRDCEFINLLQDYKDIQKSTEKRSLIKDEESKQS